MKALLLALAKKKKGASEEGEDSAYESSPEGDLADCYDNFEKASGSKAKAKALKAFISMASTADDD